MDRQEPQLSAGDEFEQNVSSGKACKCAQKEGDDGAGCSCCGMSGRGGKFRIGLMVALAIVIVVLMVQGFASAA